MALKTARKYFIIMALTTPIISCCIDGNTQNGTSPPLDCHPPNEGTLAIFYKKDELQNDIHPPYKKGISPPSPESLSKAEYLEKLQKEFEYKKGLPNNCVRDKAEFLKDGESYHGVLIAKKPSGLNIYSLLREPLVKVDNYGYKTIFEGVEYSRHDTLNPFSPKVYIQSDDYFRLILDCVEELRDAYVVKVNDTGEGLILKSDPNYEFLSPGEYVDRYAHFPGLDFNRKENPLRERPSEKSPIINPKMGKDYEIWTASSEERRGDWLRVILCDEEGWVKWREGNEIIIELYHVC